jgi:hypothetical protein
MQRFARPLFALIGMLIFLGGFAMYDRERFSAVFAGGVHDATDRATVQADLRALAKAQSKFHATHRVFAHEVAAIGTEYGTSDNVVVSIEYADSTYWRARGIYAGRIGSCTIDGGTGLGSSIIDTLSVVCSH